MTYGFVSYVKADFEQVSRLCNSLNKRGINTWLDREALQPGQRWKLAIKDAIKEGAFFLACFSSAYRAKQRTYMNEELTLAIEELRLRPTDRTWFISVLLDHCEVPGRFIGGGESLRDLQWVDLSENWEAGIERIVKVFKTESEESPSELVANAVEALRYRQQAIRDYADYPSYEFRQAQLKQVEKEITILRSSLGGVARPSVPAGHAAAPRHTRSHRADVRESRVASQEYLRVVKLPQGQGEIAVRNEDMITGRYLHPVGPDLCKVELNGKVFTVSNGLGITFAPNSRVIVAKGPNGLLLAGLAGAQ